MPLGELPLWTDGCPPPVTLAAYRLGKLPVATVEKLSLHLVDCPSCELVLRQGTDEDDSLVRQLRRCAGHQPAAPTPTPSASTCPPTVAEGNGYRAGTPVRLPAPLGQYVLLEQLAQGGMGVVFKAQQPSLHRVVAVKLALGGPILGTAAFDRLRIESEAIGRLQHENIVRVYECGEYEGRPYFSMDYVEGGNLAQKLAGRPLPQREAAALVHTLAGAVQYAHDHHIVHRDLKPANVLVGTDGTVKLTDFSLAKFLDSEQGHTQLHAVVGTASYMAPEQARGDEHVGPAADVYGLGAILYEALTGRPPFKGKNADDTVVLVRTQDLVPPSRLQPGLSRDLEAVCLRCLAKEPARRYPSAGALADDLCRWLHSKPTVARPPRWPARVGGWARRHVVALGAAAACAVILAVLYWRSPQRTVDHIWSELEHGHAVTLLDQTGKPLWFRSLNGETEATVSRSDEDAAFVVGSPQSYNGLIQLLPDPRRDHYRLTAQVRHVSGDLKSSCGLYFGHCMIPNSQGARVIGLRASFHGIYKRMPASKRQENPAILMAYCHPDGLGSKPSTYYFPSLTAILPSELGGRDWHRLELTVTPPWVRFVIDGKEAAVVSGAEFGGAIARARVTGRPPRNTQEVELRPEDPVTIPTRGSLGLYVSKGFAAFRDVVITPLEGAP